MPRAVRPLMLVSLLLLVSAIAIAVVRVAADRPGQEASQPASDGVALPSASDDPDDGSQDPVDDDPDPLTDDETTAQDADTDDADTDDADTDDADGGTGDDASDDGGVAPSAVGAGSLPNTGTGGLTTVVGVAAMAAAASRRPRSS